MADDKLIETDEDELVAVETPPKDEGKTEPKTEAEAEAEEDDEEEDCSGTLTPASRYANCLTCSADI